MYIYKEINASKPNVITIIYINSQILPSISLVIRFLLRYSDNQLFSLTNMSSVGETLMTNYCLAQPKAKTKTKPSSG